ncbi:conserved hypothetical protein [Neospora caninum Liverpool]|uniref:Cleavage and polyadenylation specificity factor subunit 2 n=1 Tax=Neospora caninum (strain Liverpool) TaxID=572307 RepID=F0VPP2_NEOCL|nr:conserved hypothetical protein [Neospora caninum Liverpool]CBZ55689.1 conserved hypothetical protein [Neospora caninum Liverpool]|eukprot:XP_003885715.1 conserved hypothetical protein [Neospora caninum Liverpool]
MVRVTVEPLYVGGRGCGGAHAALLRLGRFSLLMNCGATDLLDPHDIDLLLPVPAFLTQASQRLGKVALEGAVLNNVQNRGVRPCNVPRGVRTPELGEGVPPGGTRAGEDAGGEGQRTGEEAQKGKTGTGRDAQGAQDSTSEFQGTPETPVSLKDVSVIMEACRVLRYEERVRLFPRKRMGERGGRKEGEEGDRAEGADAEHTISRDRAQSDTEDDSEEEEEETEVYVHCIRAGHALGGAVWLFDADGRKVIFAIDHSLNPLWIPALRALFLQIARVLQRGGDVIIPMDVGTLTLPGPTKDSPWLARKQAPREPLPPLSSAANLVPSQQMPGQFISGALTAEEAPARAGEEGDRDNAAGGNGPSGSPLPPAPVWSPTSGVSSTLAPGTDGTPCLVPPTAGDAGAQRQRGAWGARRKGEEVHAEAVLADLGGGRGAGSLGPGVPAGGVFGGGRAPQGTAGTGPWSSGCGVPFGNLKFVKLLSTEPEVEYVLQQRQHRERESKNTDDPRKRPGCVFVCVPASLDSGFGRSLLIREAEEEENVVFFLSEPWPGTTAHRVWSAQSARGASGASAGLNEGTPFPSERPDVAEGKGESSFTELVLTQTRRIALSPEELLRLFEREKARRTKVELDKKRQPGEGGCDAEEPEQPMECEEDHDVQVEDEAEEEKGPLLLHDGDDRDLVDYDDDLVPAKLEDIDAAPSLFPFAPPALSLGDDAFYAQPELAAAAEPTEGEVPEETARESADRASEGPVPGVSSRVPTDDLEDSGDSDWLETRGPRMHGDRDDFAQPALGFSCASLREETGEDGESAGVQREGKRAVKEQDSKVAATIAGRRVGGLEGDAALKKEGKEEDFGVAVSAEQKAIWTAATLSVGTSSSGPSSAVASLDALASPLTAGSKLLWAGGGVWTSDERAALAARFALPPAGLFPGGAAVCRHLTEAEKRIAGAPRRRQERMKAELLLAKGGGHVAAASPWRGLPSLPFAFGVSSSACPSALTGATPGVLAPGLGHTASDAYRLQDALPPWRRQLRHWYGGEDPTGVESHTVKVSVRCHVECFSGGLEGVTSLQGLVNFLSLLRPQNVFLLPSTAGSLTRGLVSSCGLPTQPETRGSVSLAAPEAEKGDSASSVAAASVQDGEEVEMTDAGQGDAEALKPGSSSRGKETQDAIRAHADRLNDLPSGDTAFRSETAQVDLGHRLVSDLLAALGAHARVQLLVPRAFSAASPIALAPRVNHVGVLDLPSGQAVLRLDRRLWAELQAHAVPVPAARTARGPETPRLQVLSGATGLQGPRKRGPRQGADRGERDTPNWGQRLCFVARARGAVQVLSGEEREEETGPGGENGIDPTETTRKKRYLCGSGSKARRRRFGPAGACAASQSGSFWCPSLRPSFRLVSCDDPTLEETATGGGDASATQRDAGMQNAQETTSARGGASNGLADGVEVSPQDDEGERRASSLRETRTLGDAKGDKDDRRATLLLGRLQLGDVAQHLWGHLGCEGERDGENAAREREGASEAKNEIAFAPQGEVLSVANCATIRIVQDGHGSRASTWEVESTVHPWFFYLRRLFASQPFALTGS